MSDYSVSPTGQKYAIPTEDEYAAELERIESLVAVPIRMVSVGPEREQIVMC